MTVKEVDDCGAYSAVNMKNSKKWHSRLGHVGNDQFQQSAKTADRANVKTNNDVPEVCETRGSGKQTRVPHKQMKVNVLRPLERIHSNGSNERTQDNQAQEGNNVNMEDNKTKRKKKQKEKVTYCPDAQEREIEAERKCMRVSNYYADTKNEEDEIIALEVRDKEQSVARSGRTVKSLHIQNIMF
jgi:hypothetical protein